MSVARLELGSLGGTPLKPAGEVKRRGYCWSCRAFLWVLGFEIEVWWVLDCFSSSLLDYWITYSTSLSTSLSLGSCLL